MTPLCNDLHNGCFVQIRVNVLGSAVFLGKRLAPAFGTAALRADAHRTDRHASQLAPVVAPSLCQAPVHPAPSEADKPLVSSHSGEGQTGAGRHRRNGKRRSAGAQISCLREGERPAAALSPTRPSSGFPRASSPVLQTASCSIGDGAVPRLRRHFGRVIPVPITMLLTGR